LIIRRAAVLGVLLGLPALAAASQEMPGPACVSCLVLEVPSAALDALPSHPGSLEGLTVVIRVASGLVGTSDAIRALLARLAAAGARPGLVIEDDLPADAVATADVAVVDPPQEGDIDTRIFAVRSTITFLRASSPGIEIAVEPALFARAGLPIDRVDAYADRTLTRVELPPRPTSADLVAASLTSGGERVRAVADIVDWVAVAEFVAGRALAVDVTASRALSAEEIVARHQARRRRQESLLAATIASGTTTVVFEVPGFVAPVTITARTTIYARGDSVDVEQQDIRVNGAAVGGASGDPPRLPLVEPERIATPPLQISLTDAYRYELVGTTSIEDAPAFIVAFEPREGGGGLAHGRAWIDAGDFGLRRLQVTQDRLRGPIVSSEQVQEFVRIAVRDEQVDLPQRTRIYQMYEGAGHRTPIHRAIDVDRYDVNPPDFDGRLAVAHASPHLIMRETPAGVRYLGQPGTTIRAAVLGMIVDPNITTPLPFAGLSYVDLDVLGTGAQLNAFFGGTYGQLSWSVPSLAGTRWQLHGRGFAIAARYNDRAFLEGVEQYPENIRQRPAHVSVGILRPLTPRLRTRIDYELDVTAFSRADTTAAAFRIPPTGIVHGLVAAVEGERGAWTARAWWNPARRQHWGAWGMPGGFDSSSRDFQRYGVSLTRTLALRRTLGSRLEATWTGGHDLDRFSRWTVNSFDNRIHGYPTASIRYDRGLVARTATSWTQRGWRLDGFADLAIVRDPGFGRDTRAYPGVGAAIESAGPFRTLLSLEWGYGFKARRSDGGSGTQAVRIAAVRMF
jgi:hypothetical protein